MITGGQVRAARALLGWTQDTLGEASGVAVRTVRFFESDARQPHEQTRLQLKSALERAGIVFLESDGGVGVMLKADAETM